MVSVLADLVLESEAATTLALRLAGAADRAARGDAAEAALLRVALPAAKHWICKRAPLHAAEALECLGGNGYVEESGMPRLYREAPLNSIWEGSGNVTALDLLRAVTRQQGAADALAAELARAAGADPRLDAAVSGLNRALRELATRAGPEAQFAARRLAGAITVTLQAALLVQHAPGPVADAFCASRLSPGTLSGPGVPFGTLPDGLATGDVLGRATPAHR
jgi:putative acyl-CoA dehydrogenase